MRINNNLMAINTHRQLGISGLGSAKSMEKLSSGLRINRAGDDAAGLAISEKMRGQIRGINMASRNAQDSISLIQTAEGALAETHTILQRMRELAVQSANGTYTDSDRKELQTEVKQLRAEVDRIANSTEFNTRKLLEGSARGVADEIPATANLNNNSNVPIDSLKMNAMKESVANDKSWGFDGAFMLIKTNQSYQGGEKVYNASDFNLVGPDGRMYAFKTLGIDTAIKASELEPGTIIADGGPVVNITKAGAISADADIAAAGGIILGAAVTHNEISMVANGSILAAGSTFTLNDTASVTLDKATTGVDTITYTAAGVLEILSDGGKIIPIDVGKSVTLNDGTILKNDGGGKVTVECGSISVGGLTLGGNVSAFRIASQSVLDDASTTAKDEVNLVMASNYSVAPGVISTNVTVGNSVNLTSNTDSADTKYPVTNGDIVTLAERSVLARGSSITMLQNPAGQGRITTIKIEVNGNEMEMSYDIDNKILKVGDQVIAPGKSITLEDGTVLTHSVELDSPNGATGKIMVEAGRLILAENITADRDGVPVATSTNNNVHAFTVAKDSVLASGTQLHSGMDNATTAYGTRLMAGTVITTPDRVYPGSVTLGENGNHLQFSANTGNALQARYHETEVGESLTFIFSRYEPASSSLRDSVMAQIGANSGQMAFISMGDMRARALGIADVDISTDFGAATAIETINNALQRVSHQRGLLGAMQSRLEHTARNLDTASENLQAAESRIRDVDMAREIMEYTKNSILQQSAQAMLAQANQVPQNVLQLLR
jgi:flagellin